MDIFGTVIGSLGNPFSYSPETLVGSLGTPSLLLATPLGDLQSCHGVDGSSASVPPASWAFIVVFRILLCPSVGGSNASVPPASSGLRRGLRSLHSSAWFTVMHPQARLFFLSHSTLPQVASFTLGMWLMCNALWRALIVRGFSVALHVGVR